MGRPSANCWPTQSLRTAGGSSRRRPWTAGPGAVPLVASRPRFACTQCRASKSAIRARAPRRGSAGGEVTHVLRPRKPNDVGWPWVTGTANDSASRGRLTASSHTEVQVRFEFMRTPHGFVEVTLRDDLPVMRHALEDSLSSRPPRGATQDGPSTYWIDEALAGLRNRLKYRSSEPFASGNVTYLQLSSEHVEARYDFDPPDSDSVDRVPVAEFLELLRAGRERVLHESPDADKGMPPPRTVHRMPPA